MSHHTALRATRFSRAGSPEEMDAMDGIPPDADRFLIHSHVTLRGLLTDAMTGVRRNSNSLRARTMLRTTCATVLDLLPDPETAPEPKRAAAMARSRKARAAFEKRQSIVTSARLAELHHSLRELDTSVHSAEERVRVRARRRAPCPIDPVAATVLAGVIRRVAKGKGKGARGVK